MQVTVTVRLDVDEEAWAVEYGVEGRTAVRADVKRYVQDAAEQHLDSMGLLSSRL